VPALFFFALFFALDLLVAMKLYAISNATDAPNKEESVKE
jgi:hypothetical protein